MHCGMKWDLCCTRISRYQGILSSEEVMLSMASLRAADLGEADSGSDSLMVDCQVQRTRFHSWRNAKTPLIRTIIRPEISLDSDDPRKCANACM